MINFIELCKLIFNSRNHLWTIQNKNQFFVMKRKKKSFMITLYYIFVILWDLATALFFFGLMFNGNIAIKIVAFVFLTTIPCLFFYMFDIKEVICYEDYFIIKKSFLPKNAIK